MRPSGEQEPEQEPVVVCPRYPRGAEYRAGRSTFIQACPGALEAGPKSHDQQDVIGTGMRRPLC